MKAFSVAVIIAIALVLPSAATAQFGLGKKVAVGAAMHKKEKELNKELKQYDCTWNTATKSVEGCNLPKLANYLSLERQSVEMTGAWAGEGTDFNIRVHTLNNDAFERVKAELRANKVGKWDIKHKTDDTKGEQIKFTVQIK